MTSSDTLDTQTMQPPLATPSNTTLTTTPSRMPSHFKVKKVPSDFFSNSDNVRHCLELIDEITACCQVQEETDRIYEKLVQIINAEMSLFFKKLDNTPKSKKAFRHVAQEWWDEEVEVLWKGMHNSEKIFLKTHRQDRHYKSLYQTFVAKQRRFDKVSKAKKRRCQRNKVLNIEKANTSDPIAFWNFIKNLSPRTKRDIPWEILNKEGKLVTDKYEVLRHWSSEFEGLLTPPPPTPQMRQKIQNITESIDNGRHNQILTQRHTLTDISTLKSYRSW